MRIIHNTIVIGINTNVQFILLPKNCKPIEVSIEDYNLLLHYSYEPYLGTEERRFILLTENSCYENLQLKQYIGYIKISSLHYYLYEVQ